MKPLIAPRVTERQLRSWAALSHITDLERRGFYARSGIMPISGGGEIVLRKWQAALEVVRGTNLAATRKVYGMGHMTKDIGTIFPAATEERGTFIENYRSAVGLTKAGAAIDGSVTFEDLGWWLELALKGGVAGVLESTTAYRYTFVPTAGTDDLDSATVEWGDDTQAFKGNFAMVDSLEISGSIHEQLKFRATLLQDDMLPATFTGALSDRTTEDILTRLCKAALGAAGAVPSSYMTGRFIGFKLTIKNNLFAKYFADGGTGTAVLQTNNPASVNGQVILTAAAAGVAGNAVSFEIVDTHVFGQSLSVNVSGSKIVVVPATDGAGVITTTATQLKTAYDLVAAAVALAVMTQAGTGASVIGGFETANLAGGGGSTKYSGMGRKKRTFSLEMTFEGNSATITERGVWEAGTQKVARITATGSAIAGGAGVRTMDIVMPGVWTAFPVGERDSNTVFAAVLTQQYDSVLAYDLSVAVVNALVGPYT